MNLVQTQAYQKFIRQSPRKLRLVADVIRGLRVENALVQLEVTPKKAAGIIGKVVSQAKANIKSAHNVNDESIVIKSIQIQEAPRIKRWRPVSRGRAHPIIKRMSHIQVVVEGNKIEVEKPKIEAKKAKSNSKNSK